MTVDMSAAGEGDTRVQALANVNPGKRKREESESDGNSSTLASHAHEGATDIPDPLVQQTLFNICEILKSQDTSPSILQFDLASLSEEIEPNAKRAKLSTERTSTNTIASKISSKSYRSLDEFVSDADKVMLHLSTPTRSDVSDANMPTQGPRAPDAQDLLIAKISALKTKLDGMVMREKDRLRQKVESEGAGNTTKHDVRDSQKLVNGHIEDSLHQIKKEEEEGEDNDEDSKTVLTLYANAQGHKQLFSSLQKPVSSSGTPIDYREAAQDLVMYLPVKETGLPNGISTTKILLAKDTDAMGEANKRPAAFKEVFGPRTQLLQLQPPRTPKPAFQQNNGTVWHRKRPAYETTTQRGYSKEKMVTGHWLGYAGVAPAQESATPEVRRKLRDRALSSGEAQITASEEIINAQAMAKEEALFRSVYSSFAPSCDNSGAIYSDEVKANVWWERHGQEYFNRTFAIDPELETAGDIFALDEDAVMTSSFTDEEMKEAIEEFEPEEVKLETKRGPVASGDQDVEEMLKEISQLLETLHSYQRIRNSSLNSTSRPGSRPGTGHGSIPLHRFTGTPSMPSTAEIETYNTLKAQLALMISILPPYAVARLNGEMLEELNVTSRIPVSFPDARGVMEEDSITRDNKAIAMATASHQARANSMAHNQYANSARTAPMVQPTRSNFSGRPMYNGAYNTPHGAPSFSRQPLSSWQSTPAHSYTPINYQRGAAAQAQQAARPVGGSMASAPYRAPIPPTQYNTNRPGSSHLHNPPATPINGMYSTPQSYNFPQRAQSNYQANTAISPTKSAPSAGIYANTPQPQIPRANMTGGYSALQIAAHAQQQQNMRQLQQNQASPPRNTASSSPQPNAIPSRASPANTPAPIANMNAMTHMPNGSHIASPSRPTSSTSLASPSKAVQPLQGLRPGSSGNDFKRLQSWNQNAGSASPASPQGSHTSTPRPTAQTNTQPDTSSASLAPASNGAQNQQVSSSQAEAPAASTAPPAMMVNGTGPST